MMSAKWYTRKLQIVVPPRKIEEKKQSCLKKLYRRSKKQQKGHQTKHPVRKKPASKYSESKQQSWS